MNLTLVTNNCRCTSHVSASELSDVSKNFCYHGCSTLCTSSARSTSSGVLVATAIGMFEGNNESFELKPLQEAMQSTFVPVCTR